MTTARFFDLFELAILLGWGVIGLTQALRLFWRGIPVLGIDLTRTPGQVAADCIAGACLCLWVFAVVTFSSPLNFNIFPDALGTTLVEALPVKAVGLLILVAGLTVYCLALIQLGVSWRIGIDRDAPGPLVTSGIYAWTRHPIYVGFDLLFIGTFLALGRLVFLVLALIMVPVLHLLMLREERFLAETHGQDYQIYCDRVGRYYS